MTAPMYDHPDLGPVPRIEWYAANGVRLDDYQRHDPTRSTFHNATWFTVDCLYTYLAEGGAS